MRHRRALLALPLILFALQCRTAAAPEPEPLRLIAVTRSEGQESFDVPLERLQTGTAFDDEHLYGYMTSTVSAFEFAYRRHRGTDLAFPPWIHWDRGAYTDIAGKTHPITVAYTWDNWLPTPLPRPSTGYRRYYIAPSESVVETPIDYRRSEGHFQPFLENLPATGRVQLQVPIDLDGKRMTYTFIFQPRG